MRPFTFLYNQLGPYHVARIRAAAALFPTAAIEFGADNSEYAWDRIDTEFERHTLTHDSKMPLTTPAFARALCSVLDRIRPSAIAVPGWEHRGALLTLIWAVRNNVPTIVMSDSQYSDGPRAQWREWIKSRVVAQSTAGFVGGERHADYMKKLGMPAKAIFTGCAVVDNAYFEKGADAARAAGASERTRLGLPKRYFVTSSRFIPKKNLPSLLRGYASFRRQGGEDAPKLVLLGDGPLRDEVLHLRATLGLEQDVLLPGFQQYEALPIYYGLAEAFVLVSTTEQWGLVINEAMASGLPVIASRSCGCTPELVADGENGILVDALDTDQLARAFSLLAERGDIRERMGKKGREMINGWSPTTFAQQLVRARDAAAAISRQTMPLDMPMLTALLMSKSLGLSKRAPGAT